MVLTRLPAIPIALLLLPLLAPVASGQSGHGGDDPFAHEEAFFRFEQQIVTATRAPTPLVEAPAVVSVITRGEIRRHGWRTVGEALRSVPGLWGYFDGVNWAYGVRGISGGLRANNRLLKVLLDGQSIAYRYDTTNWLDRSLVPIGAVERIEVIRGPASALYGADAFLGVINIITGTATRSATVEGGAALDGAYRVGGELVGGATKGALSALMAVAYTYEERSGLTLPSSSPNPRPHGSESESRGDLSRPFSALLRAGLALGDGGHQLRLDAHMMGVDAHAEFTDFSVLSHENRVALSAGFVRLLYEGEPTPGHLLQALLGWAQGAPSATERLDTGSSLNAFEREEGYHAVDTALSWRWSAASWLTTTIGVDHSSVFYDLTSLYKVLKRDTPAADEGDRILHAGQGDMTFHNVGLYAQAVVKPLPWLILTAGGRYDHHSEFGPQGNARAGLVLHPLDELTVKVLAGTSFKAPSPLHLYAPSPPMLNGDIVGASQLEPERAQTIELAAIARPLPGLSVSVAGYYNEVSEKVEFVQEGEHRRAVNNSAVESAGVEVDVRFQWRALSAYAFFAWDRSLRSPPEGEDPLFGELVTEYPTWMGGGGIGYHLAVARLHLQASVHWATERRASQTNLREAAADYYLPGYAVVDLALSTRNLRFWGARETRFAFRIADVGDSAPTQPGFGGVDVPTRGRFFQLTVTQEL